MMFTFIRCFSLLCLSFSFATSHTHSYPKAVKLLSGHEMPVIGFGTYLIQNDTVEISIETALNTGYRLFDNTYTYGNEKSIGKALKKWLQYGGGKREEVFVSTKLPVQGDRLEDVSTYVDLSLNNLGLNYLDMYLLHAPMGVMRSQDLQAAYYQNGTVELDMATDLVAIWKGMEKMVKIGKVKSIGLCNVNATQLMRVWRNAEIKPSNLQIENNAYLQQEELVQLARAMGIVVTGYSPLGSPYTKSLRRKRETSYLPELLSNEVLHRVAKKHNKSSAQVSLRFNLQRNLIVIPKSVHAKRIKENFDIFDFTLDNEDMRLLTSLDQRGAYRKFVWCTFFKGIEKHPEYPWPIKC